MWIFTVAGNDSFGVSWKEGSEKINLWFYTEGPPEWTRMPMNKRISVGELREKLANVPAHYEVSFFALDRVCRIKDENRRGSRHNVGSVRLVRSWNGIRFVSLEGHRE